jgi:hypothetical protein
VTVSSAVVLSFEDRWLCRAGDRSRGKALFS